MYCMSFGIYLELEPDDEEKAMLEQNIQVALQTQAIALSDAIDIRQIKNIKLANQLLKIRRKKKQERDQLMQQQNIQAQAQANAQAQQVAAQAEVQKSQALIQQKIELANAQAQIDTQKLMQEATLKKELMQLEFEMNLQLKGLEVQGRKSEIVDKEDRKDDRTKLQATQQSELIQQRQNNLPAQDFESSGFDTMGGGFNLGSSDPR